jgi:hypothetical protein
LIRKSVQYPCKSKNVLKRIQSYPGKAKTKDPKKSQVENPVSINFFLSRKRTKNQKSKVTSPVSNPYLKSHPVCYENRPSGIVLIYHHPPKSLKPTEHVLLPKQQEAVIAG